MMLHTCNLCSYQASTSEIYLRQDLKGQGHYSNVPTKYQLPTPYVFRNIARTKF